MKLINYFKAALATAGIIAAVSCTDLTSIEDRLDTLESDVQALQTLATNLNKNVESLYYLKDGAVITNILEVEGGWDLTLSDGRKLELRNGVNGANGEDGKDGNDGAEGHTPVVSISEDGYWVIDNVKQNVKAVATDGKTPQFGVDAQGYWTVSYDGGTPERIKDVNGNYVSAKVEVTSGSVPTDSYFKSVTVVDNTLVIVLRDADETVVTVPIIKGFSFIIKKDGAVVEGLQKVAEGATVEFDVEQTGVAAAAIVACPAGFEVELTEDKLTVTAVPETKATASSSKDIAILAVSTNGVSAISKIQVEKATAEGGENEGGENEGGENEGGETPVVPQSAFEKYMAGEDITVGEITINKATYGDATLITNESDNKDIATDGVYFVDSKATDVTINGTANRIVILSADENIATIKRTATNDEGAYKSFYINASENNDYMIFSNIKYVTLMTSGNVFGVGGTGDVETIYFHKCQIEVPADMNMLYGTKNILNFNMTDCDVKLHKGTAEKNLVQTNTTSTYETLTFKNNIFYCTDGDLAGFRLFSNNNATIAKLDFSNNTIAGVYCKATYGYVTAKSITVGDVVSNLLYLPKYTEVLADKYIGILHIADKTDEHLNMVSNLAFYDYDAVPSQRAKVSYYSNNGTIYNKAKADNPIPSPDYTNGVFTQGEDYKSFGAQR